MWFPMIRVGDSVIEARHSDARWRFRRRVTRSEGVDFVVTTRGEPTPGLGWLLDQDRPRPLEALHPAATTVLRGARDYAHRELRTPWWAAEVERSDEARASLGEPDTQRPPLLPWNAHVVHHYDQLDMWRRRQPATLPLIDLQALAGAEGDDIGRAWDHYVLLGDVTHDGVPGPTEVVARFEPGAALVRDAWHWGLALGDEDPNALPPDIGAELAWRHAACLSARHHAALAEDVVMLAQALRHVPDPREPFAVLVHGKCVIRARWRLAAWEWSTTYGPHTGGYWRRGDFTALLRSDLVHVGLPTYLHPVVAAPMRDAFELAVSKRGESHDDDLLWRELLAFAAQGQIVDCLVYTDFM